MDTFHTTSRAQYQPMHIAIVAPFFYPNIGGVEHYTFEIARRCVLRGDRVSVITSSDSDFLQEEIEGIKIYRLPYWCKVSNTPINPLWYFWLRKFFKNERPDLIHAHAPVPFLADLAAYAAGKIPFVLTYHSGSMRKGGGLADLIIAGYEKCILPIMVQKARRIAVVSTRVAEALFSRAMEKVEIISPGVDLSRFAKTPLPKAPRILFVGRIERSSSWKGVAPLLHAFVRVNAKLPEAQLMLVGGGDAIETYRNLAKTLQIEKAVEFCGAKTGDDLVLAYQGAKVVVLPSTSESESFGMTLIEGMATGRPVVGSRIGGIPEVIEEGVSGLLAEPNNPEQLAEMLLRILCDDDLAEQFANNGRLRAETYSWEQQAGKYFLLYEVVRHAKPVIAQIVGYYPPHTGGMEAVCRSVSETLARMGYQVRVFTSSFGGGEPVERKSHLVVRRLFGVEVAHTPILFALPFYLFALPRRSILHVHIAQAFFPEIARVIAKLRGHTLIGHFHLDIGPSGKLGVLLPLYKRYVLAPTLRAFDQVIVFSEIQKRLLVERYQIAEEHIVIIPNGVGEEFFGGELPEPPQEIFRLLFVGRLAPQKKVGRLLEMMQKISVPCALTIVGDGEEESLLKSTAHALGVNERVAFLGKQSGDALLAQYKGAHAFVISSDVEGMPLVVLEAMAAGLPVIASDVLGLHELVDGVGILVSEPYPESFARVIDGLYRDTKMYRRLATQSRTQASRYTWDAAVLQMIACYHHLHD